MAELDADYPLDLESWPSLEGQVAALADDIAYDNHDIDDGLRAGFLTLDDLLTLDFMAEQWDAVRARYPGAPQSAQLRELVRDQIGIMVNDLIVTTQGNCEAMTSIADVRGAGRALAAFSPEWATRERRLKAFLYERLYYHPEQLSTAKTAHMVIAKLYAAFDQDPSLMNAGWVENLPDYAAGRARHIADFIGGMTDRYAIDCYRKIFGSAPEGLSNV